MTTTPSTHLPRCHGSSRRFLASYRNRSLQLAWKVNTCTNSTSASTSISTHYAHAAYAINININDDVLVLSIYENRAMVDCHVVALELTWSRSHTTCQDQSRVFLGRTNSSPPTCRLSMLLKFESTMARSQARETKPVWLSRHDPPAL
jgi:hypothetical protein